MPATPTPWASIPLPAEGDLPDVPTDLSALGVRVDNVLKMLMTTGTSSTQTMPTVAPTGGANLLNVGPSITALQSTQTTQAGQITTLQTNATALQTLTAPLNNAPNAFSYYNGSPPSFSGGPGWTNTEIGTFTVPTAGFQRMLICTVAANYIYANNSPQAMVFFANITIGGTQHNVLRYSGAGSSDNPGQHFNGTFVITIPASTTAVVNITLLPGTSTATSVHVADDVPMIRGVLLPWSNGPALPFPF